MRDIASDNLRALTLALLLVFLVVSILAFLPQISHLNPGQLRVLIIGFSGAVLLLGMWAVRQTNRRLVRLGQVARGDRAGRLLCPVRGRGQRLHRPALRSDQ